MFQTRYTFGTWVPGTPDAVRPVVETALRAEGFGVVTEIDVAATLRAKLGIERDPYVILSACDPPLANRAIEADPSVGALLPCNVVVRAGDGGTIVEAMDPAAALGLIETPAIGDVAAEARARLRRMIAAVAAEYGVADAPVEAEAAPAPAEETDEDATPGPASTAGFVR